MRSLYAILLSVSGLCLAQTSSPATADELREIRCNDPLH